jgi:hypothetical protein
MSKQRVSSNSTFLKLSPCNWTQRERVERAVVLFAVVVLLLDLLVWRPN